MNKSIYLILILIFSFSLFSRADDKIVKIVVSVYPPYEYTGEDGKIKGIDVDTITESFKSQGYNVEFTLAPWRRAVNMTINGEVDAIASVIKSKTHDAMFLPSDPISYGQNYFYKKKSLNINPKNFEDLKPYTIGTLINFPYGDNFVKANLPNLEPINAINPQLNNLKKLKEDRVDLIICEINACTYFINQNTKEFSEIDYIKSLPVDKVILYYLGFSKKNIKRSEQLLAIFNQGLFEYINSGKKKENLKKYNLEEFSQHE